jgi:hypothetical protein
MGVINRGDFAPRTLFRGGEVVHDAQCTARAVERNAASLASSLYVPDRSSPGALVGLIYPDRPRP